MKYLPRCLAILLGCAAVGIAVWITKEPNCLWGLWLVCWMASSTYPHNKPTYVVSDEEEDDD